MGGIIVLVFVIIFDLLLLLRVFIYLELVA
jgi:hypothetical protein